MTKEKKEREEKAVSLTYEQICDLWSRADHWPLSDAVRLMLEMPPKILEGELSSEAAVKLDAHIELATNCIGESLPLLNKQRHKYFEPGEYRVRPTDAIAWAESFGLGISEVLKATVKKYQKRKTEEYKTKLSDWNIMEHRCRGIAALLWGQNPKTTLTDMVKKEEFLTYGCEGFGKRPQLSTIETWIKDLNPNRSQGRRPKSITSFAKHPD